MFTFHFCFRHSKEQSLHNRKALLNEDPASVNVPPPNGSLVHQRINSNLAKPDSGIEVLENPSRPTTESHPNETPTSSRISSHGYPNFIDGVITFLNLSRTQPRGPDSGLGSAASGSFASTRLPPTEQTSSVSNQEQPEDVVPLVHTRINFFTSETIDNHTADMVSNVWEHNLRKLVGQICLNDFTASALTRWC